MQAGSLPVRMQKTIEHYRVGMNWMTISFLSEVLCHSFSRTNLILFMEKLIKLIISSNNFKVLKCEIENIFCWIYSFKQNQHLPSKYVAKDLGLIERFHCCEKNFRKRQSVQGDITTRLVSNVWRWQCSTMLYSTIFSILRRHLLVPPPSWKCR